MSGILGRKKEIDELNRLYFSRKAEFVAVYGRRRVGKTFLVDEALKGKISFRHAGLSPVDESGKSNNTKQQLQHFYQSLQLSGMSRSHCPKNWLEAFFMLEQPLKSNWLHFRLENAKSFTGVPVSKCPAMTLRKQTWFLAEFRITCRILPRARVWHRISTHCSSRKGLN